MPEKPWGEIMDEMDTDLARMDKVTTTNLSDAVAEIGKLRLAIHGGIRALEYQLELSGSTLVGAAALAQLRHAIGEGGDEKVGFDLTVDLQKEPERRPGSPYELAYERLKVIASTKEGLAQVRSAHALIACVEALKEAENAIRYSVMIPEWDKKRRAALALATGVPQEQADA